jgi:hypothetical protein
MFITKNELLYFFLLDELFHSGHPFYRERRQYCRPTRTKKWAIDNHRQGFEVYVTSQAVVKKLNVS